MVTSRAQNRRLLDRYDLAEPLGRGGMGVVWLAQDTVLQRQVAIKEVEFPAGVPDDEAEALAARVMREARAAARLNHPNVTTIYDVVRDEGRAWIVMELVAAPTLTEVVTRDGPLPVQRAAAIGMEVLGALEAAHAAGIIHRDVKPSNVMVPESGHVKLADFGVAAVQGDPKITMTGLIIGSPSYMAPEQATEGRSTEATDLWGLGTTLYFAVEGQPAFDRGSAIATLAAVTHDAPRPMERAGALEPIILGLLRRDPAERLTSGELCALLTEIGTGEAPIGPAPATAVLPPPVRDEEPVEDLWIEEVEDTPDIPAAGAWQEPVHGRSRMPLVLTLLGILLLAFVLGGLWLQTGGEGRDAQTAGQDDAAGQNGQAQDDQAEDADAGGNQAATGDSNGEAADSAAGDSAAAEDTSDGDTAADGTSAPEDWATYDIGGTGSTVAYPSDWQPVQRSATQTDLTDPAGGRYLRTEYTDTPGDDAVAAWEEQSESFGARKSDYVEVRIEPVDFRGHEAALWEYTYTEGGAQLHAYNLAVVAGGRGYALNFQTREDLWEESQPLWEQFTASFEPSV